MRATGTIVLLIAGTSKANCTFGFSRTFGSNARLLMPAVKASGNPDNVLFVNRLPVPPTHDSEERSF
jgi:hypothetical protein